MKIWSSQHTFNHNWERVAEAALRKYPNPMNPNVIGMDVIDRHVEPNGKLYSHRLMQTNFGIPGWLQTLTGYEGKGFVSEHSEIDPKAKTLHLWSRNLSLNTFMNVEEHLTYSPHPENEKLTLLKQEAIITCAAIPMATSKLESALVTGFQTNCQKGRNAIEWLIKEIQTGDFGSSQQRMATQQATSSS